MAVAPNNQKLIITNKQLPLSSGNYKTDMRTIEQWANLGIVRKLIAGSGITLDPSSGVDAGNGVEISSSGGGGGGGIGAWEFTAGPDVRAVNAADPFGVSFSGMAMPISGTELTSSWLTIDQPLVPGGNRQYTFTCSWLFQVGAGQSVSFLPILEGPAFTGSIDVEFTLQALAIDFLDAAIWSTNPIAWSTNESYQTQDTDFANNPGPPFGDLSLQPFGTAFEGNGIVSSAGDVYFGSAQANVTVFAGTTFP